jgi:TetR/AcrR family transcriptional repressor of nem operon
MKVSRRQVDANRSAILDAAGRLFRERGFDGVSVSEVMKAAGLTHGAFYGYFRSKDDLFAATLSELTSARRPRREWTETIARYLSPAHRDDGAGGCPVAALAAETSRQSPPARAAMTQGVERMIARIGDTAPGDTAAARRRAAVGAVAAMVGAVILSRAVDDPNLSDELLAATREALSEAASDG